MNIPSSDNNSIGEWQHLSRLKRDPQYAAAWKAQHACQPWPESPLSNGRDANATDIVISANCNSSGDSFFNSYWFAALVVVVFLVAVWFTG